MESDKVAGFGLTIEVPEKMGFKIMADGFLMCNEIFALLFEKFEEVMMKKRVDSEYKIYAVKNAIQYTVNAISISELRFDKGDKNSFFESYNYEKESEEPPPSKIDSYAVERKLGDPSLHAERFRISHLNKSSRNQHLLHRKFSKLGTIN